METTQAILCSLHDALMVLAPRLWLKAELSVVSTESGIRLSSIQARGGGGMQPKPHPKLNLDPKQEAIRLSEGLTELALALADQGKSWTPHQVMVERDDDHAQWQLKSADGSTAWLGRLVKSQLDQLVYTDALFALLEGSERAIGMLQAQVAGMLGEQTGWRVVEGGIEFLTAAGPKQWDTIPIGRYDRESFSLTWAWADSEFADQAERVETICAPSAQQAGLSALWRPHLHCDEGFAWALGGHVAVALGARGLFRAETADDPTLVLHALMKPR